jgi:hypothetical protein
MLSTGTKKANLSELLGYAYTFLNLIYFLVVGFKTERGRKTAVSRTCIPLCSVRGYLAVMQQ